MSWLWEKCGAMDSTAEINVLTGHVDAVTAQALTQAPLLAVLAVVADVDGAPAACVTHILSPGRMSMCTSANHTALSVLRDTDTHAAQHRAGHGPRPPTLQVMQMYIDMTHSSAQRVTATTCMSRVRQGGKQCAAHRLAGRRRGWR